MLKIPKHPYTLGEPPPFSFVENSRTNTVQWYVVSRKDIKFGWKTSKLRLGVGVGGWRTRRRTTTTQRLPTPPPRRGSQRYYKAFQGGWEWGETSKTYKTSMLGLWVLFWTILRYLWIFVGYVFFRSPGESIWCIVSKNASAAQKQLKERRKVIHANGENKASESKVVARELPESIFGRPGCQNAASLEY